MPPEAPVPLLLIGGPTAAGKTALALAAAERLSGEILCADSRQVYRGLDRGTSKPTNEERARVPHHLLDLVPPTEAFTVADWLQRAVSAIHDVHRRGRLPVVVGGTGLYLRRLVHGLCAAPGPQPALRLQLAAQEASQGAGTLHRRLAALDPGAARRLHRNDLRRIIRALEVVLSTGQALSELQRRDTRPPGRFEISYFVVTRPREVLRDRARERMRRMLDDGWMDEVASLLAAGVPRQAPGLSALGYRPLARAAAGEISRDEAQELVWRDTSSYIKRQLTWFRGEAGAVALDAEALGETEAARRIAATVRGGVAE